MKRIIDIDESMLTEEEVEECIKLAKTDFSDVTILLENTPTVETDIEVVAKDAYEQGYTDGWKERYGEPEERPQGEWIPCYVNFTDGSKPLFAYCKCSFCNKPATGVYKFCPNCGASMKPKTCTNCETFGQDCGDCEVGDDD